ncbi:MAG: YggS family pyridoxal phosphate-dependent enzyme [Spirochaetes bacterium]|nr:YggS family pyridoxal phosphate-dependent enzyme [Spirochaetota bacterium]MBU1080274.1 YggS family pyridoxal phosphate-dependent enzyme [Spirochaetota bacterium]
MRGALGAGVSESVAAVRERMLAACARAGRAEDSVRLLAVTKFNPADAVAAAYAAGLRVFGENRVQEAEAKFSSLSGSVPGSELHLLGHLQSNKAKKAVAIFDCVQSVDSEGILAELARRAEEAGKVLDVLFELHTGEESKSGFPDADSLLRALERAADMAFVRPRGLMTMAPYTDDEARIRASFRACAAAFSAASSRFPSPGFDTLSMGMTNDFELAIEEGSTMIRVGTAIFGNRASA